MPMWTSNVTSLNENPVPYEMRWVVVDFTDGTSAVRKTYKLMPGNQDGVEAAIAADLDELNTVSAEGHADSISTAVAVV